jgi:periplasmic protein TonB
MRNFLLPFGLALVLSLLLHLFFFNTFNKTLKHKNLKVNSTDEVKKDKKKGYTSIKYVKLQKPKLLQKPLIKQNQPQKTLQQKPTPKKVVKKRRKPIIKDPKITKNVKTIKIPKAQEEIDLKQLFTINKQQTTQNIKEQEKRIEVDKERYLVKKLDRRTQQYIKLYGEKFYSFSKEQKEYLKQNLSLIGKITQRYLKYPPIAGKTRQSGVNVVEFMLHPNGDITDLHISDSSYFTALDKNTIETIRIAYKDYPKPTQPTKIKIYVNYILY